MRNHCFPAVFKTLSVSNRSVIMSFDGNLFVYSTWHLLSFLDIQICAFYQICTDFGHYFFKCLFCPIISSSWPVIISMLVHLMVSHKSLSLFIFLHTCFLVLLRLYNFSSPVFKFADSLLSAQMCYWSSLVIFFHFNYYTF